MERPVICRMLVTMVTNLGECIHVPSNIRCPALITQKPERIYEAVDFLQAAPLFGVCVCVLLGGHTLLSPKGAYF